MISKARPSLLNQKTVTAGSTFALIAAFSAGNANAAVEYFDSPVTLRYAWWYLEGNGGSTKLATEGLYQVINYFPRSVSHSFGLAKGTGNSLVKAFNPDNHATIGAGAFANDALQSAKFAFISNGANAGYGWANFTIGTSGYVGFRFSMDHGSTWQYGWANLTLLAYDNGVTINSWAYDTAANTAITVGDTGSVPEPAETGAGLGLLALGAAGLRSWRKSRRNKAA